jgi:hypothetical protein
MTVLNLQIGASTDDAFEYANGVMDLTAGTIIFGHIGIGRHCGLRFTGVSGLSGATIDEATLTFRSEANDSTNFIGDWYADDREDPPAFTSTTYDISSRTRTTATCEGDGSDFGNWTNGQDETFEGPAPGIKGIIQELADSYDPAEIALLHIYTSSLGERLFKSYNQSSSLAPKLAITYTAGGPPPVTGQVSFAGIGALSAAAGLTIPASVAFGGVGLMSAEGTIGVIHEGAVIFSGVGELSIGTPVLTLSGQVSMLGVGFLSAIGERIQAGVVSFAGVGSMSAIGEIGGLLEGRVSMEGVGSLSAIGHRVVTGQVSMVGVGALSALGIVTMVASVSMSGIGSMSAVGQSGEILYTRIGTRTFEIDTSDYPPGSLYTLESNMESEGVGAVAVVRLYNITLEEAVLGSELSIPGPGPGWARSSPFSLPSGVKTYRIEYGGVSGALYVPGGAAVRIHKS